MWGNIFLRRFHVNLFVKCFPSNCYTSALAAIPLCVFKFKKFGCHNILQCSSMHDFVSIHSWCCIPRQTGTGLGLWDTPYGECFKVAPNIRGGESLGDYWGSWKLNLQFWHSFSTMSGLHLVSDILGRNQTLFCCLFQSPVTLLSFFSGLGMRLDASIFTVNMSPLLTEVQNLEHV